MRIFAAVRISPDARENLARWVARIKINPEIPRGTKWVESENLHLTLKFFGEVDEEKRQLLEEALSKAANRVRAHALEIKGIGAFPSLSSVRVLWAGLEEPTRTLNTLAQSIEEEAVHAGFPPADKPFSEHLTLARFKSPSRSSLAETLEKDHNTSFGKMAVDHFSLIQSVLGSQGPTYRDLQVWSLR